MDYDYLDASNGSGDAALMHLTADRLVGSTVLQVDSVSNVPAKFIGTVGTLLASGFLDPTNKTDFKGHVSGTDLAIDAYEPGSSDIGNTEGQVVIIKPNTGWANRVAKFIKNMTNLGTPEDVTAAAVTADSVTTTGDSSVGGNQTVTGNNTVDGNQYIAGTSHVGAASVASAATITPSAQIYSVTALAVAATIAAPSFASADGIAVLIRIKDDGTARALTFAADYTNMSGLDTPTTTVAGKLLTIGAIYNSATSKWEIQGINQQA